MWVDEQALVTKVVEIEQHTFRNMRWALSDPSNIFVGHAKQAEVNAGAVDRFLVAAAKLGREPQVIATIADGYGRDIFTIYRFQ